MSRVKYRPKVTRLDEAKTEGQNYKFVQKYKKIKILSVVCQSLHGEFIKNWLISVWAPYSLVLYVQTIQTYK